MTHFDSFTDDSRFPETVGYRKGIPRVLRGVCGSHNDVQITALYAIIMKNRSARDEYSPSRQPHPNLTASKNINTLWLEIQSFHDMFDQSFT